MKDCEHRMTIKYDKKYARTKCVDCGKVVKKSKGYDLPRDFELLTVRGELSEEEPR